MLHVGLRDHSAFDLVADKLAEKYHAIAVD